MSTGIFIQNFASFTQVKDSVYFLQLLVSELGYITSDHH